MCSLCFVEYRNYTGLTAEPTKNPTTDEPSLSPSKAPTEKPTESPTVDGCEFDIDTYLEKCYCTDDNFEIAAAKAILGYNKNQDEFRNNYQGYSHDNNGYFDNSLGYLNLALNIVTLSLLSLLSCLFYVNFGCGAGKQNRNGFEKVYE